MFDAIRANRVHIPPNPFAVGGYVNGAITDYIWHTPDWDAFPDSYHVRINVTGDPSRGNALDVEQGDATPGNVQQWIESRGAAIQDPLLVYCNRSNLDACLAARNAAQNATGIYAFMWVATLDGTIEGRSATQFAQTKVNGVAVTDCTLITNPRLIAAMMARLAAKP